MTPDENCSRMLDKLEAFVAHARAGDDGCIFRLLFTPDDGGCGSVTVRYAGGGLTIHVVADLLDEVAP